jgi:Ulp1 family protease
LPIAKSLWIAESQLADYVLHPQKGIAGDQLSDQGYQGCLLLFDKNKRFLRSLDIFRTRLLILPINIQNAHWSLLLILLPKDWYETIRRRGLLQSVHNKDNTLLMTPDKSEAADDEGLIIYFDSLEISSPRSQELATAVRRYVTKREEYCTRRIFLISSLLGG